MTNTELIQQLSKFPKDMEVSITINSLVSHIIKIDKCVNIDTNKGAITICGNDRDYYKERKQNKT